MFKHLIYRPTLLQKKLGPISFSAALCMTVPISYALADSTFLIINQLLMIQPVTLSVGRKVVGQLSLNDKSTDFSICTIYPQGLPCAQWGPYLLHADRNAYKNF